MPDNAVGGGQSPQEQGNTTPKFYAIGEDGVNAILQGMGGGGSGSDGGNLEARIAKVESDVQHIQSDISEIKTDIRAIKSDAKTDFRLLFGAIITVALGLAALMAKGFHWL